MFPLSLLVLTLGFAAAGPHGNTPRRRHHFRAVKQARQDSAAMEKTECEEGAWQCIGHELKRKSRYNPAPDRRVRPAVSSRSLTNRLQSRHLVLCFELYWGEYHLLVSRFSPCLSTREQSGRARSSLSRPFLGASIRCLTCSPS